MERERFSLWQSSRSVRACDAEMGLSGGGGCRGSGNSVVWMPQTGRVNCEETHAEVREGVFVFTPSQLGAERGLCSLWLHPGTLDAYAVLTLFYVIFVVSGWALKFIVLFQEKMEHHVVVLVYMWSWMLIVFLKEFCLNMHIHFDAHQIHKGPGSWEGVPYN